jgi:hypothetical protein
LQNERFETWRALFNEERPHEALGQIPPVEVYKPSSRTLNDVVPVDYSECDFTRMIQKKGEVNFAGSEIQVGTALAHHVVGLVEIDLDVWLVVFAGLELGIFEPGDRRISPIQLKPKATKRRTL